MKIYIQDHACHAGKWIYSGYAHAWAYLDHEVKFINDLSEVKTNEQYKLFICDSKVTQSNIQIIKNSYKTYLYVQPNSFPDPWGSHPNFKCCLYPGVSPHQPSFVMTNNNSAPLWHCSATKLPYKDS